MIIKAEQKYLRTSPRKLRLVADMVREIGSPKTALEYLVHINKRAALPLEKVLKQAMANAKNNAGIKEDELKIKEIIVNEGPFYKRFRPVSRGRAHSIKKRTSHIRVVLETKAQGTQNARLRQGFGGQAKRPPAGLAGKTQKEKEEYGTES